MEKFEEVRFVRQTLARLFVYYPPAVMGHYRILGVLFRFIGCGEGTVCGKTPGRSLVLPCPGERRAHRCDPHPWSRWRHELQASGLSGSLPGFRWRHLPALHMQRFEPGLQSEGLSRRVGESSLSVWQHQWMWFFLWRHCRGSWRSRISCVSLAGLPEVPGELQH